MKILATSDLHGRAMLWCLTKIAKEIKPDLVLVCGDVGGYIPVSSVSVLSRKQQTDVSFLDQELDKLGIPSYFILGNDDWCESNGAKHYLSKLTAVDNIMLAPFELVHITPFTTNREANENKIRYELDKIVDTSLPDSRGFGQRSGLIMVAHMPPFGAGDILYSGEHCGSKSIEEWIKIVQPKIWFCGHIHEDYSVNKIGNTLVVNCACRHDKNSFQSWLIDSETLDFEKFRC